MWNSVISQIPRGIHCTIVADGVLSFQKVAALWQEDAAFRAFFNDLLAAAPYRAFRWETPPVRQATWSQDFEFVLLDSPSLEREAERDVFAQHFTPDVHGVAVFENLGGDATLIVPNPLANDVCPTSGHSHLAVFVRNAPAPQRDNLWRCVGETLIEKLGPKPIWLSTAGAGVAWLHVRFDSRPKYYGHRPFAERE